MARDPEVEVVGVVGVLISFLTGKMSILLYSKVSIPSKSQI